MSNDPYIEYVCPECGAPAEDTCDERDGYRCLHCCEFFYSYMTRHEYRRWARRF